jgi:glucuronoarabinoxylan endo-1,4-beta-xylanase
LLGLALTLACSSSSSGDDGSGSDGDETVGTGGSQSGGAGGTATAGRGTATGGAAGRGSTTGGAAGRGTATGGTNTTGTGGAIAVNVVVDPANSSVVEGQTVDLTATVTGTTNSTVTWSVKEAGGGQVASAGADKAKYTAPATAGTFHVVATSAADVSKTGSASVTVVSPNAGDVVVTLGETHQTMDGFGASDNYNPQFSDAQADMMFSQTKGIGMSLLRVSLSSTGSDLAPVSNAQKAFARGAKIWTAPWSPPGNWKDNGSENNGGHLLAAHYGDWANVLAGFVTTLANGNVTVYAVSVQNEPDYTASYASCLYSADEMVAFVNVLAPKLAALSQKPKLMMPETSGWANVWNYWDAAVANGAAAQKVDILAAHQYFLDDPPSHPIPDGKVLWQTEDSSFEGFGGDIGNAVSVSRWIHNAIVHGGVSAWHYWAIWGRNGDNEGLLSESGATTKRFFALGNFSKFVRPGFVRIGATAGPSGTLVSAYKDPNGGAVAVVVINTNGASVPFAATLSGANATSVTPWVTSAELDLGAQPAVPVAAGRFATTLSATSITTFASSM